MKKLILSLKENLDESGCLSSSAFDVIGLIGSLEYVSEVVAFAAAKSELVSFFKTILQIFFIMSENQKPFFRKGRKRLVHKKIKKASFFS